MCHLCLCPPGAVRNVQRYARRDSQSRAPLYNCTNIIHKYTNTQIQIHKYAWRGTLGSGSRSSTVQLYSARPSCKKWRECTKYDQHANRPPSLPILGSQIQIASSRDTKVQSLPGKSSTVQHCVCTNNFIPLCKRKDLLKLWALNQCIAMKGNLQLESDLTLSPRIIYSFLMF